MKQLTHNLLKINFQGINLDDVSKIEFAFSQDVGKAPLKVAEYPSQKVVRITENMVGVIWTKDETALFRPGENFYADTRITMKNTEYQPCTPIIKLRMNPTLFEQG